MQTSQKSLSSKKPVILITTSNINSPKLGDTDIKRKMTLPGICEGMQIMNIALGGMLHQSVSANGKTFVTHSIPRKRPRITHKATLTERSFLEEIFKSSKLGLNGGHQQAVNKLLRKSGDGR